MFEDLAVKSKTKNGRKLPPGRKRVAYKKMFMGLLYLGLFVVFGAKHNFSTALEPSFTKKNVIMRYVDLAYLVL
jgi:lysophospholipid acyltransferase